MSGRLSWTPGCIKAGAEEQDLRVFQFAHRQERGAWPSGAVCATAGLMPNWENYFVPLRNEKKGKRRVNNAAVGPFKKAENK